MKKFFTPLCTPGLQAPKPRAPPPPSIPGHLPVMCPPASSVSAQPSTRTQHAQFMQHTKCSHEEPLQQATRLLDEPAAKASMVATDTGKAASTTHACALPMHLLTSGGRVGPGGAFNAILEAEDDDESASGTSSGAAWQSQSQHGAQQARHARSLSTEHTSNFTAPSNTEIPNTASGLHKSQPDSGAPNHLSSCTAWLTHAGVHNSNEAQACTSSTAQPALCKEPLTPDEGSSVSSGRTEEIISRQSEVKNIPQDSIAVRWGLLSNEIEGGDLGNRLLAEYQLGPVTKPEVLETVGRAPDLYGRAVFMVRHHTCLFCPGLLYNNSF
jgi:hypothetical protein